MIIGKKAMSIVLSLILLFSTFAVGINGSNAFLKVISVKAFAEDAPTSGTCGTNLTWNYDLDTNTLTISGTGNMRDYNSEDYNGYNVTTAPWKPYYRVMETVIIEEGVKNIGKYAFWGCNALIKAIVPDSVTSIGALALNYCDYVFLGDNINSIGTGAIKGLNNYCNENTTTSKYLLNNGFGLILNNEPDFIVRGYSDYTGQQVEIIRYIGTGSSASIMASVDGLPVTSIGNNAFLFSYSKDLTHIALPNSITKIDYGAFYGCTKLNSIVIPESVTSIGESAFSSYTNAIFKADSLAAENYTGLFVSPSSPDFKIKVINDGERSIEIINYIGSNSFVSIPSYIDGVAVKEISGDAFKSNKILKNLVIPDSIISIEDYAFAYCSELTDVTIGDNVASIGNYAFYGCKKLISLVIPNSIISVGNKAFSAETNVIFYADSVIADSYTDSFVSPSNLNFKIKTIDDNGEKNIVIVKYIGTDSSVSIPSFIDGILVKEISVDAFQDDTILLLNADSVIAENYNGAFVSPTNPDFKIKVINNANKSIEIVRYIGTKNSVIVPSSIDGIPVEIIGDYAFYGYIELITDVTLPESITKIGSQSFKYCSNLKNIIIPESVTSIGEDAFSPNTNAVFRADSLAAENYSGLFVSPSNPNFKIKVINDGEKSVELFKYLGSDDTVIIPSSIDGISVKKLGYQTFYYHRNLNNLIILDGLSQIDNNAFSNNTSLHDVYFYGDRSDREKISIGNNNTYLFNSSWHYNVTDPNGHYGTEWISDETSHWNTCKCGEKRNIANHSFDEGKITKIATIEETGTYTFVCTICGYKRNVEIPKREIYEFDEEDIIKGNSAGNRKTYDYGSSVTFSANIPNGGSVQWYVNGEKAGNAETLTVKNTTSSYLVQIVAMDKDGNQTMDEEYVTIKNGFFDKLIWFFKHLFNPEAYNIKQ